MSEDIKNKYEKFEGFKNPETDRAILFDVRGCKRTQTLFIDVTADKTKYPPLYTMRGQDQKGLISAYQIYMHSINEYDAAIKLVGSIEHWERLCELQWFMEGLVSKSFAGIHKWRQDMVERDIMLAKKTLLYNASVMGDTSAARTLINLHKAPSTKVLSTKKATVEAKEKDKLNEKDSKITKLAEALKKRENV